ncbi:MAG TPA: spore coat U domain-containing protein, partial [Thermoanaerobaculia bacterium]|nr:spore coat U domain-containing protein [Thermoanaerobaculia bacterium]
MRNLILLTAASLSLLIASAASGATDSALMQVTVRVVPHCRIAVTDLAFGAYDPLVEHAGSNLDGTAEVRVVCTRNERATILMEERGSPNRTLRSGQHLLTYGIFTDAARTQVWGSGGNAVQVIFDEANSQELTVFGR